MAGKDHLTRRFFHKLLLKKPAIDFTQPQTQWWLLALTFCLLCLSFFVSPLLRIKTITCVLDTNYPCPDFIIPEYSKLTGKLIYLQDLSFIYPQIKAAIPDVHNVNVSRLWPNTVAISIVSQIDVANLQIPASTSALIAGNNLYVTKVLGTPSPNLPTIIASSAASLVLGDQINDDALATAVNLAARMPTLTNITILSPLEIKAIDRDFNRYLFTSNKTVDSQLDALQLIQSTTTINEITQIYDLRFDHPVLKQTW